MRRRERKRERIERKENLKLDQKEDDKNVGNEKLREIRKWKETGRGKGQR